MWVVAEAVGVRGDLPGGGRWASGDAAGLCCISWLELVVPGGITAPDKRSLTLISVKQICNLGTYQDSRIWLLFLLF